jgi:hypothetical protein
MLWIAPIGLVVAGMAVAARKETRDDIVIKIREFVNHDEGCCDDVGEALAYSPPEVAGAFVQLTGLRDDQVASQGFALAQPMDVRIYAVGEGSGDEMYDYGWLVDASSRDAVWRMDYGHTEHAGGASKNRMVDEVVALQPGNYVVYFRTDGSHSWGDWNSSAPRDKDAWGITLIAPDGMVNPDVIQPYDLSSDPAFITQLVGMGDDVDATKAFNLEVETAVRIYALGEGMLGEMFDYAWIEDSSTGRAVWEMTYRTTEHAGGGDKNRLFDGIVVLPAGEYVLHYRSDDSHSAEDWNATPPNDPFGWGVSLLRVRSDER